MKPDDVCLALWDDAGSLIDAHVSAVCVDDGGLQLSYVVAADCVNKLSVSMTACGVVVGPAVSVQSGYDACNDTNNVASYDVGVGVKTGMAVNADGSTMAISFARPLHQVHVFQLMPSFERVCVIGRKGTGPAKFDYPRRLCFTDAENILVCDRANNRVQQLTVAGEYLSSFAVQDPISLAAHGDLVAIGTLDGPIEIHSLATGELIRCFGSDGDGPGQIGDCATGLRFTHDRTCLLVAEFDNCRMALFTVDGVFAKHIGAGILDGWSDISFGTGSEIIVADYGNHRICVFSPDGDTLIKAWGLPGDAAGQFELPTALAISGSYLYVMDGSRVQVFE